MQKPTLRYIGKVVSMKTIRDFVLDAKLTDESTILLHRTNYDNVILEYRATYGQSLFPPYHILGVLIQEDTTKKVPFDRVGFIQYGSPITSSGDYQSDEYDDPTTDERYYEVIYRCGYCGNVVDFDGREFDSQTRRYKIDTLEKFNNSVTTVHGKCCANRN